MAGRRGCVERGAAQGRALMIKIAIDLLDHWQTLFAGILALLAGFGTVVATMIDSHAGRSLPLARKPKGDRRDPRADLGHCRADPRRPNVCKGSRCKRSQSVSRHARSGDGRVLAEAAWARETYPQILAQAQGASIDAQAASVDALVVRQCITKGAFAELRAACVRQGGPLTGDFLDLEREIDSFAGQYEDKPRQRWAADPKGQARRSARTACLDRNEGGRSAREGLRADLMVRIAISAEAFEAIARSLPLSTVAFETEATERGEHLIWMEARWQIGSAQCEGAARAIVRSSCGSRAGGITVTVRREAGEE